MRGLEITFVPPNRRSGGGLGVYQSVFSLASNCPIDYIGPDFEDGLFGESAFAVNKKFILDNSGSKRNVFDFVFKKVTTSFYKGWKKIVKLIEWDKYDFVHIETSRYLFVLKEAQRHKLKTIIRMHNIETDYGRELYKKEKSVSNYLRYRSFSANERKTLSRVDAIAFLTDTDIARAKALYNIAPEKCFKVPVCISAGNNRGATSEKKDAALHVLMTGSLNFKPSLDGILWFIDNVWLKCFKENDDYRLTIAGAMPPNELYERAAQCKNVDIVASPPAMEPFFLQADIVVAPTFYGAGMKVKVAEALSYGVSVIGTAHAWIGYEEIEVGKFVADTPEQMSSRLEEIKNNGGIPDSAAVKREFDKYLSLNRSIGAYKTIVEKLSGRKL